MAKCQNCEWENEDEGHTQKLAARHAREFKHTVNVHVAYLHIYYGSELLAEMKINQVRK